MRKVHLRIPRENETPMQTILYVPESKWEHIKCKIASWLIGGMGPYAPSAYDEAYVVEAPDTSEHAEGKYKDLEEYLNDGRTPFNTNNFTVMERMVLERIEETGIWTQQGYKPVTLIQQGVIKPIGNGDHRDISYTFTTEYLTFSSLVNKMMHEILHG